MGMHFFNPAVMLKLVEVIYAKNSSDAAIQTTFDVAKKMGKVPIIVKKDSPGFISHRANAPTALFMQLILDKGSPKPEQFDAAFKALMPMTPFELMDYVGLDIVLHTQKYYSETLSKDYTPRKALVVCCSIRESRQKSAKAFMIGQQEDQPLISAILPRVRLHSHGSPAGERGHQVP